MKKILILLIIILFSCIKSTNDKTVNAHFYICNFKSYSKLCIDIHNLSMNKIYINDLKGLQTFINVSCKKGNIFEDITDSFFASTSYNLFNTDIPTTGCCNDSLLFAYDEMIIDSTLNILRNTYNKRIIKKYNKEEIENFLKPRLRGLVFLDLKQTYSEFFLINDSDYRNRTLRFIFKYPQKLPFEKDSLFIKDFLDLNDFKFPETINDFSKFNGTIKSDTLIFKFH